MTSLFECSIVQLAIREDIGEAMPTDSLRLRTLRGEQGLQNLLAYYSWRLSVVV